MQKKAMPAHGAEVELTITDLNTDGSAVAKEDGLVFFVDLGLPGELVLARVEGAKKNVVIASRVKTLRKSPGETEPFCRYFGECGGCTWQNLDYDAQLLWKHGRVEAALRRIAKVDMEVPALLPSPAQQGFRNKMEYAFGTEASGVPEDAAQEDGRLILGLRRRNSHEVCQIDLCPLQSDGSGKVLQAVLAWARLNGLKAWDGKAGTLRHLVLRESAAEGGEPLRMVELVCGSEVPAAPALQELYTTLEALNVKSFTVSQRKDKTPLNSGERIIRRFGADTLPVSIGHLRMEFPAQGFVQTNAAAAGVLYEQARELAGLDGSQNLWDIYCGVGSLGLYMADKAKSLLGVEVSGAAARSASENAAVLGFKHCKFVKGDAARVLSGLPGHPDVILTDPPRGGMSPKIIPGIKAAAPAKIVYVSCDPATLARDIAALAPKYQLKAIRAVDMFPHTPHVECVALLELA